MTNKVEELASKAVGVAKAAKATVEGLTGVFRHLVREHGEVSALLMRLKMSSDPETRRELWPTIRRELLSHETAEMREVYPTLRQNPETRGIAEEHDQDAESLEDAIDDLTSTATDSDQWQPALEQLITLVQEHVRDEEDEYFPIADRAFKDRSDEMLKRYEQTKTEAMRQLSSTP